MNRSLENFLPNEDLAAMIMHVTASLDYSNSLYLKLSMKTKNRHQLGQNVASHFFHGLDIMNL